MKRILSTFVEFFQSFVLFAAVFTVIYLFVFRPTEVSGSSMLPNLHNGERLIADEISYRFKDPERGDIIILKEPHETYRLLVKRLIGKPGEKVEIKEDKVFINDRPLLERYLAEPTESSFSAFIKENQPYILKEGEYFLMGDNRDNSLDSREFGPVKRSEFIGKAVAKYWPPQAVSLIRNPGY
jgi:signal peptidase I